MLALLSTLVSREAVLYTVKTLQVNHLRTILSDGNSAGMHKGVSAFLNQPQRKRAAANRLISDFVVGMKPSTTPQREPKQRTSHQKYSLYACMCIYLQVEGGGVIKKTKQNKKIHRVWWFQSLLNPSSIYWVHGVLSTANEIQAWPTWSYPLMSLCLLHALPLQMGTLSCKRG